MVFPAKKKDDQPKRRSTLGFLFNPDIGDSIKPMGQSIDAFLRIIAMVFASAKLFPSNHPAFDRSSQDARLSLYEIFATAWSNLRFTREGLPQVLFFAAVVASMGLSVLFIIIALLSAFTTQAHAASMFTAPGGAGDCPTIGNCNATPDLAISWLNFLFMKTPIPAMTIDNPGSTTAIQQIVPQSMAMQQALYTALAFYSNGILVIASVMLLYHLLSMVAETAHHGVAMGKRASQIWAPLRLVFALGLLIPISTSNGLNTGQFIVLQMAKWGSGLASQVWKITVASIADNATFEFRTPTVPWGADQVVNDLIAMRACQMAFNAAIKAPPSASYMTPYNSTYKVTETATATIKDEVCVAQSYEGAGAAGSACDIQVPSNRHNFGNQYAPDLCGHYDVSPPALSATTTPEVRGMQASLYAAHATAITQIMAAGGPVDKAASKVLVYVEGLTAAERTSYAPAGVIGAMQPADVVDTYKRTLQTAINTSATSTGWKSALNSISNNWANQGWVTAGAWFNTIARAQGAVINAAEAPSPSTSPPMGFTIGSEGSTVAGGDTWCAFNDCRQQRAGINNVNSIYTKVADAVRAFGTQSLSRQRLSTPGVANPDFNAPGVAYQPATATAAAGTNPAGFANTDRSDVKVFLGMLDHLGQLVGAWGQGDGIQFRFGASANPLAELAYMGYKNVEFGIALIGWGATGSLLSGLVSMIPGAGLITGGLGALASLAITIGGFFLFIGFAMAFVLPLIPFIKFFFNVITWILGVFEAIVAAPLLALAHITPHGDGLPGDKASGGYYLILSVFLRPVLMVFGLVAGLLLFFVAISFLNATFSIASAGTGYAGSSLSVVGKIAYSIMYCALAYICANTCFKTISYFPEHGMNWLGSRGVEGRQMGDQSMMSGAMQGVAAYMGEKGLSSASRGLSGIGGPVNKIRGEKAAAQQHQELLGALRGGGANAGNAAQSPATGTGQSFGVGPVSIPSGAMPGAGGPTGGSGGGASAQFSGTAGKNAEYADGFGPGGTEDTSKADNIKQFGTAGSGAQYDLPEGYGGTGDASGDDTQKKTPKDVRYENLLASQRTTSDDTDDDGSGRSRRRGRGRGR